MRSSLLIDQNCFKIMTTQPRLSFKGLKGFPEEIDSSGKTLTLPFLEASNEVIEIIESFGKLFKPIVMDMRGNTRQLLELYNKDTKNWMYLEDMVLFAPELGCRSWMLWLKRALELIERFFTYILNDEEILAQKSDSLQPHLLKSYDEVLKPYHGFFIQKTFSMLYRFVPSRKSLLGENEYFEENINSLRVYLPKFRMHIIKIDRFLKENGFDDQTKV
ncbi:hypothetical protein PVAND_002262 [Polypedilum vanderplanki]|uniref:Glycolipid transfer protein domain-containing protein n=1 Tax=Polypedilum vanderplanki TaxID=319348 RepID=A0A9J6BRN6_POLVA|nr:hypothetical protein PVAND_002262 [Polypedilum vanderplanki]